MLKIANAVIFQLPSRFVMKMIAFYINDLYCRSIVSYVLFAFIIRFFLSLIPVRRYFIFSKIELDRRA